MVKELLAQVVTYSPMFLKNFSLRVYFVKDLVQKAIIHEQILQKFVSLAGSIPSKVYLSRA